jgi:ribosomal protein L7/L12
MKICPSCKNPIQDNSIECEWCGFSISKNNNQTITLINGGKNKLAVVKILMDEIGIKLKDAKNLVDNAPSLIYEGYDKTTLESIKNKLIQAGAEVEIN